MYVVLVHFTDHWTIYYVCSVILIVCWGEIICVAERYKLTSNYYMIELYLQTKTVWRMKDRSVQEPQIWPSLLTSQRRLRSTIGNIENICVNIKLHSQVSVGKQIPCQTQQAVRRPSSESKYYIIRIILSQVFLKLIHQYNSNQPNHVISTGWSEQNLGYIYIDLHSCKPNLTIELKTVTEHSWQLYFQALLPVRLISDWTMSLWPTL